MRYIAHRGLFEGPNSELENDPAQINIALKKRFNVEVDVWYTENGWYTGHDKPTYKIEIDLLEDPSLWLHCKNAEALIELSMKTKRLHYFWHQTDLYTLTSYGIPWIYPGNKLMKTGVCVMPEWNHDIKDTKKLQVYGICSDYISQIREIRE